jgi:hypothetical protein
MVEDCDNMECYENSEDEEDEDSDDDEGMGESNEMKDDEIIDESNIKMEEVSSDETYNELQSILNEVDIDMLFPPLDGTALYKHLCLINHSCDPNVIVKYSVENRPDEKDCNGGGLRAYLVALRDIEEGEELVQSYINQYMSKYQMLHFIMIILI